MNDTETLREAKKIAFSLINELPPSKKVLKYGTAGFREKVDKSFHSVYLRMGMLAALRSLQCDSQWVGLMVTASHNPQEDNGVKLVDTDGGMLTQLWEPLAEQVANARNVEELQTCLGAVEKEALDRGQRGRRCVIIGRDCRPHSGELAFLAAVGVRAMGGIVLDLGEVTTPQVHWSVARANSSAAGANAGGEDMTAGQLLRAYYDAFADAYVNLCRSAAATATAATAAIAAAAGDAVVDLSFGVGSKAVDGILDAVSRREAAAATDNTKSDVRPSSSPSLLRIDKRNVSDGSLALTRSTYVNEGCGAEFVQKGQKAPCGVGPRDAGRMLVSFDGDADRIVFHAFTQPGAGLNGGNWALIDGDKILCLLAVAIMQELRAAKLDSQYTFGAVQTAYANGASSKYLQSHGIPVSLAKTGVKFVHHAALAYDVGVYFEANGHGTALFSPALLGRLQQQQQQQQQQEQEQSEQAGKKKCPNPSCKCSVCTCGDGCTCGISAEVVCDPCSAFKAAITAKESPAAATAAAAAVAAASQARISLAFDRLRQFSVCLNPTVGDSMSVMLAAMASLRILNMSLDNWMAMYTDFPSKQLKVPAPNKALITTSADESYALSPAVLQTRIAEAMGRASMGRAFVRPSGTEDVVRVYAEAASQAEANVLADACVAAIREALQ